MIYQTVSAFFAHFSHANIKMPIKLESLISYVFVTPSFHRIHHHFTLPHTDSNYGNIFSIWDRLFGTYMELNKDEIVYGVDTDLDEVKNSKFTSLIERPFKKWFNHFN